MTPPANPFKSVWIWIAHVSAKYAPAAATISLVSGIIGGLIVSNAWDDPISLIWGILVGIVGSIPAAGTIYWDRITERAEANAEARERVMEEAIPSLLESVSLITTQNQQARKIARDHAAKIVTKDLITAFAKVNGVRAIVYGVSDDGESMIVIANAGRNQRPQPFLRGTERGEHAFENLKMADSFVFEADLSIAPGSWSGSGKGYATFISAPIRVADSGYGMLTLDAPNVGDLESRNGSTVAIMAATLAIYFSEAARE